jgi:hypothetical protein
MKHELTAKERLLADLMSEVSERCFCAGWMQNLEYVLWNALLKGEMKYGYDRIITQDISALRELSLEAGCWIVFDDEVGEKPIALIKWQKKFHHDTRKDFNLLHFSRHV